MNQQNKEKHSQAGQDEVPSGSPTPQESSTRRELIERYGKYALVAAPLFMFVSKARAIHSRP
jgi:hypothetical protein